MALIETVPFFPESNGLFYVVGCAYVARLKPYMQIPAFCLFDRTLHSHILVYRTKCYFPPDNVSPFLLIDKTVYSDASSLIFCYKYVSGGPKVLENKWF